MRTLSKYLVTLLVVLAFGGVPTLFAQDAAAPTLRIDAIDSTAYPEVSAYLSVLDGAGFPILGLSAADFQITEAGQPIPASDVQVVVGSHVSNQVVLALDTSMDPEDLEQMKAAALGFVANLGPTDQIALVLFSDAVTVAVPLTNDKNTINTAISELNVFGSRTDLYGAVVEAAGILTDTDTSRRAIIVVTNTGDNANVFTVESAIEAANAASASISPLAFLPVANVTPLNDLANQTGGQGALLGSVDQLRTALLNTSLLLRQGYQVRYQTALPADGSTHPLAIQAQVAGQTLQGETSFAIDASRITVAIPALAGRQLSGLVPLSAQASGPEPIARIEYFINDVPVAAVFSPPYTFEWDASALTPGTYNLRVRAVDVTGNLGEATLPIEIVTPIAPTVSVVVSATQVRIGEDVTVQALIGSGDITQVEFIINDVLVAVDSIAPYQVTFNTSTFSGGEYRITVNARDVNGTIAQATTPITFIQGWLLPGFLRNRWVVWTLLFGTMFMVITLAYLSLLAVRRSQQMAVRRRFNLTLANDGNVDNRYGLRIVEDSDALRFRLEHNNSRLPVYTVEQYAPPDPQRPVLDVPGVAPASPMPAAAGRPQPTPPNKPGPGPAKKAKDVTRGASRFASMMMRIANVLPPSIGKHLLGGAGQIRQAQSAVNQVESKPREMQALAGEFNRPAPGAKPAQTASSSPAPTYAPQTTSALVGGQQAAPATPRQRVISSEEWLKTPIVPAGESVTINFIVDPRRANKNAVYEFSILSEVLDVEGLEPVSQPASVEIRPVNLLRRLLPTLIFIATVLVIYILARFAFLFSSAFGSLL